ncbi:MAG: response regulator [Spirochaetaceae bacterium]|jgi:two-component system response regulator YesN|nr:response regulator [Spirochaetaceae bacterium]
MYKAILLDDEHLTLRWLTDLIGAGDFGLTVAGTAKNGGDGLELIKKIHPDIVITDIRMPKVDGLELIQKVSEMELPVKFIILSGYGEFEYAKRAIRFGVMDYLLKPVSGDQMKETLEHIISVINREKEIKRRLAKLQGSDQKDTSLLKTGNPENHSPMVTYVLRLINERISLDLSVDTLAGLIRVTPGYLSTTFKRETGMRLIEYITNARIEKAKNLLEKPGLRIHEVSLMVGFQDSKYFAHVFKKKTGTLPSDFRNKNVNEEQQNEQQGTGIKDTGIQES